MRLDVALSEQFNISRSLAANLVRHNKVKVNNSIVSSPKIFVTLSDQLEIIDEYINIKVLFECDDFLVVHKPYNMSVCRSHTTPKAEYVLNELVEKNFILSHNTTKSYEFGLANRIDKQTEGIIILCRTDEFLKRLVEKFKNRDIVKVYRAYVKDDSLLDFTFYHFICEHQREYFSFFPHCYCELGSFEKISLKMKKGFNRSFIDTENIQGKETITYIKKFSSYIDCIPVTGHNHQIRLLLSYLKTPVLGDLVYGKKHHRLYLFSCAIGL